MPTYVMLTTLTDEGRKTLMHNPGRIKEVNKEIEAMGITLKAQYALLGQFDFLNVLEAASNEAITKMAVQMGSRGTVSTLTLPAIPTDEFIAGLEE
ncbi:MAG: GYD domain-containing protein [bacterium]